MSELRLVAPALVTWLMVLAVLITRTPWWALGIGASLCACLLLWQRMQAVLSMVVGTAVATIALIRVRVADAIAMPDALAGVVTRPATPTDTGFIMRLQVDGHPGELPVFFRSGAQPEATYGQHVVVAGEATATDGAGVSPYLFLAREIEVVGEPTGVRAWVAHVREVFNESVERVMGNTLSGDGAGLMPAMVLGDTSLQSAEAQDAYINTGLAHLSAVSGGNVAILTTAAVVALSLLGIKPVGQAAGAMVALCIFVTVVGMEPSVLRAMITGMVGLIAVMSASRTPPMHALCVAVILGLTWDSSMASSFGFALSAGATAGIVGLYPLVFRGLAPLNMPEILTRAIAVTLSAEILTMPLVAAMAGHVSTVSVVANVLAAAVVPPITILGMMAVILSLLPLGLEIPLLYVCLPLVEWIALVARVGASVPGATIPVPDGALGVSWVAVACAWIIALALLRHMKVVVISLVALMTIPTAAGVVAGVATKPDVVDQSQLVTYRIPTLGSLDQVPAGTQLIIVEGTSGSPATRPFKTADGVPIIFPMRDGDVVLYSDGTQRALSGRF